MKDYNKLSAFDSVVNGYDQGYEDGHEDGINAVNTYDADLKAEAYNKGLEDAWNVTKKIYDGECDGGYSYDELDEIFGTRSCHHILESFTVFEAVEKVKAYEEKQMQYDEFKVGDEVYQLNESYRYVISAFIDDDRAVLISKHGNWGTGPLNTLKKTGRHFDQMNEILEKLEEE